MTEAKQETGGAPEGAPVVDFDILAHRSMAESDAAWAELRGNCPVAWTEANGGAWVVSSYDTVTEAFRNWQAFRSGRDVRTVDGPGGSPEYLSINAIPVKNPFLQIPEELDPPLWHPYRKAFTDLLSPRAAEALMPRVKYWATKLIDDVIETGQCDLVDTLTGGLPAAVVLEWLGFPEEDWHRMGAAMHNMAAYIPDDPASQKYHDEMSWAFGRVKEAVAERRENPRDDATSTLANLEIEGKRISFEYAVGMVNLAYSGGVDTTTSVGSAAFVHMFRNPEDRQRLIDNPDLIDRAMEEFLRVYPPARTHGRTVVEDTELGGCLLRKDDRLIISEVSACHDEATFPDADKFVMDRFPNRHVAFGMGMHRCAGSHIARLMFKEMLTQVLERMPDYQVVEEGLKEYPNWAILGGFSTLPVTFTPGERRLP